MSSSRISVPATRAAKVSRSSRPRLKRSFASTSQCHNDPPHYPSSSAETATPSSTSKQNNAWDWERMRSAREHRALITEFFSKLGSTQTRESSWQPHHSLNHPPSDNGTNGVGSLTMSALVAAGAHIGHNKSLMRPSFLPYAYGTRSDVTVIDLDQTLPLLRRAAQVTRGIAASGGTILWVGTSPGLRPVVQKAAERMGPTGYFIGERWLPGTITNRYALFGAHEVSKTKIHPDLVVFMNPLNNLPALRECAIEKIPTVGIVDSNADPRIVMYAIPANDDSIRTAELVSGVLSLAAQQGVKMYDGQEIVPRRSKQDATSWPGYIPPDVDVSELMAGVEGSEELLDSLSSDSSDSADVVESVSMVFPDELAPEDVYAEHSPR